MFFFWKSLEHYLRIGREQCPRCFRHGNGKIRLHEIFPKIFRLYGLRFCEIFCATLLTLKSIFDWKNIVEEPLEIFSSGKFDFFLSFKIFLTFGNIVFWENIGLLFFGIIPCDFKPCDLEKRNYSSHRFYFLIAQAFLFFEENIVLKILLGFI